MAFQTNKGQEPGTSNKGNADNESWKAAGFINVYLPTKAGGRRKVGAIPLREAKVVEKELSDFLAADPENIKAFVAKMIVEFQTAEITEDSHFDLG